MGIQCILPGKAFGTHWAAECFGMHPHMTLKGQWLGETLATCLTGELKQSRHINLSRSTRFSPVPPSQVCAVFFAVGHALLNPFPPRLVPHIQMRTFQKNSQLLLVL